MLRWCGHDPVIFEVEPAEGQARRLSGAASRSPPAGAASFDYRLRIADIVRDYGLNGRAEAPEDSRAVHDR